MIRPPRLWRMGFQQRLFFGFAALLSLAMLVAGTAVSITTSQRVSKALEEQLQTGAGVLNGYLRNRAVQLENSVAVLTSDFGFKAAVATADERTIEGALANHGARIGADFVLLTKTDGSLLSSTRPDIASSDSVPFPRLLRRALESEQAYAVVAKNDQIFQLFVRPVRAPSPVAYVYMAFALDTAVAAEISELTHLEVSFGARLSPALAGVSGYHQSDLWLTHVLPLNVESDGIHALLRAPLTQITDTVSTLLKQLAFILLVTLLLCLVASMWLARQMSNPVATLISAAKRIRRGDYNQPVVVPSGEMSLLAEAINTMSAGIEEREGEIRRLAFREPTTGYPNKLAFTERFGMVGEGNDSLSEDRFALCLFSLVNSRDISFNLGFDMGEALMRAAVERLRGEIREQDELFAFSGDQYALILPGLSALEARPRVNKISTQLSGNYTLGERTVSGRCSAAVVSFPDDIDNLTDLIRGAETTLDEAIRERDLARLYVPDLEASIERRLRIIADFDRAFVEDQFHLVYQPKVNIAERRVHDCEALLRWIHPELGNIPPDEFIELAEQSGKIYRITQYVLETAIEQAVDWSTSLSVRVAINLSARDLDEKTLHQSIEQIMRRLNATGDMFTLEITESAVLGNKETALVVLKQLKRMGIRLAIDDYGTGYSSLSQLKLMPVDELKIDKAFIMEMNSQPEDAMIVKSTVELGHNLGLQVVAEGVENGESLDMLLEYGCDKVQGYYFSKPLKAAEFEQWFKEFSWRDEREIADVS